MSVVTNAHLEAIQPPLNQLRSYQNQSSTIARLGFAAENAVSVATHTSKFPEIAATHTASYSNANLPSAPATPVTAVSQAKSAPTPT